MIYLDYNASTPIDPAVAAVVRPLLEKAFGKTSSGHLASTPAMSPITISATIPMRFHLPRIHFSLPPDDTRKRNITDAVPDATIARFTPHRARINTCCSGYASEACQYVSTSASQPRLVAGAMPRAGLLRGA